MAKPRPEEFDKQRVVAENRRARYDYFLDDKFEAGIMLTGTEVKSLRAGACTIDESYAEGKEDDVWVTHDQNEEWSQRNR